MNVPDQKTLRLPLWFFCSIVWAVVVSFAYGRGMQLETRRLDEASHVVVPRLHYGDKLPAVKLPDTQGRSWNIANLPASWHVVEFGNLSCSACRSQLAELNSARIPGCNVVAVLRHSTLFGSAQAQCSDYAKSMHLGFPVLVDIDGEYSRKVCDLGYVPYIVILDREARIRAIFTGYEPRALIQAIRFLMGTDGIWEKERAKPISLRAEMVDNGRKTEFTELIRSGWTVVTLAKFGCPSCNERATLLARFRQKAGLKIVFIYSSDHEAISESRLSRGLPFVNVASEQLFGKLARRQFPVTFIFRNGSLAYSEEMAGPSVETMIWHFLGSIQDNHVKILRGKPTSPRKGAISPIVSLAIDSGVRAPQNVNRPKE